MTCAALKKKRREKLQVLHKVEAAAALSPGYVRARLPFSCLSVLSVPLDVGEQLRRFNIGSHQFQELQDPSVDMPLVCTGELDSQLQLIQGLFDRRMAYWWL